MLVFPNCKINLGLIVTGKRTDGYHNIETIFYPVQLKDVLEIIHSTARNGKPPETTFTHSGMSIDGEKKDNLCVKAWHLLKKNYPQLPAVKIHLHKAIPMGAGLGGGSADAAFTLMALNDKYALGLSNDQLSAYALELGSDCPFFIINSPCIASGRGETLQSISHLLSGYRLVLVSPGIHINTQWAFSQVNPAAGENSIKAPGKLFQIVIAQPVNRWKDWLTNDFEKPVFEKYPAIRTIKETFYEQGALFASMSGSGSTVFGIFERDTRYTFNFPENYLLNDFLL